MLRYAARLAVAVLAVAAGLGVPAAAQASTCSTSHGVTVVVDFHQLGKGVQAACDAGGAGRTAADQLTDVGHTLTYVQRQPGFVCRVDGAPSDDPCVNTPPDNAYWSLWWSDAKSGTWQYSSLGVGSLKVPDGGYVALSWQGQSGKAPPRVTPKAHAAPSPTAAPTPRPSAHPTAAQPSAPSASTTNASPAGGSTSGRADKPAPKPHHPRTHQPQSSSAAAAPHRSASPSSEPQAAGAPATAVADTGDEGGSSGVPGWLPPTLVLVLLGAAGTVAVVRRKRAGGG